MKHPMQYIKKNRFVENKIITMLVDAYNLNKIAAMDFDNDDYDQLLQLMGYSTSGVPYRDQDKYDITDDDQASPETVFEEKYKELKNSLRPIMADLFNKCEEDLE